MVRKPSSFIKNTFFVCCSQPEDDINTINPHLVFSPAGDVTHFSYFTTFQSSPFLTLSLTFHQLLFQISRILFPVLLATFPRNSKTLHLLIDTTTCVQNFMFPLVLYFTNSHSGDSIWISKHQDSCFCTWLHFPIYHYNSVYLIQC